MRKIADTGRGYSTIYFISSQYIKDKDRAALEDELSKQLSISVRILDRSWIIESVFPKGHFALAIDTLNISTSAPHPTPRVGAQDAEKRAQLDELEVQITDQQRLSPEAHWMPDVGPQPLGELMAEDEDAGAPARSFRPARWKLRMGG